MSRDDAAQTAEHPTESDVIRAYALGHAHGQHRGTPETRDWDKARDWFRKLTFEEMHCTDNPDRDHEWVVALDGDGEPLDYLHCGYCGVRKPT